MAQSKHIKKLNENKYAEAFAQNECKILNVVRIILFENRKKNRQYKWKREVKCFYFARRRERKTEVHLSKINFDDCHV